MAGVLAFVGARGDATARRDAIADALRIMEHRGPADSGVVVVPGGAAILGVNSRGITDVEHGGQPLRYPATGPSADRYVIVLDGEIFNAERLREELTRDHGAEFATVADAEAIAAAYHYRGPSAVNDLRGMYAFVIWDSRAKRAFGARDPWGIKPLYHLARPEGAYLASEKKALLPFLEGPATVDPVSLSHYLTLQYVPEPRTMHAGVERIGAGESFAYTPGLPLANRRYTAPTFQPVQPDDPDDLIKRIREALRDSVHAATRADAPVGAFLSGGLDSAAIVALAREVDPGLRAYTVGFDAAGYSEIEQAEATAAELGVPVTARVVEPRDVLAALPRVVWHLDDPIADPAAVVGYLLAERASADVRVALSGEGADELFGGYPMYREPLSLEPLSGLPDPMRRGLRAVARVIPHGVKGRSFLERGTTPLEERYFGNARAFSDDEKAVLLRHDPGARTADVTGPAYAEAGALDEVTRMQVLDIYTRLRGDVLVKVDRMSMAHSLEPRLPFLDPAVFAVAATIPTELRVPHRSLETKVALRRALAGLVPEAVLDRPRGPVRAPIRGWLRGELGEWADTVVAESQADDCLNLDLVRGLLREHRAGEADHARQIWTVLVFCLWHAAFRTGRAW